MGGDSRGTLQMPSCPTQDMVGRLVRGATFVAADEDRVGILVRGAEGLRKADWRGRGMPDGFCRCRVGPAGTAFAEKDPLTERRSSTVMNSQTPQWNFSVSYPRRLLDDGAEFHLVVTDQDFLFRSDCLGELRLTASQLEACLGRLSEHALAAASDAPEGDAGRVTLMVGPEVEVCMLQEARALRRTAIAQWFSPAGEFWHLWRAVGQAYLESSKFALYTMEMLSYMAAGRSCASGIRRWFLDRSRDSSGNDTYTWQGPWPSDCVTHSGHEDVSARLRALGEERGSCNGSGRIRRVNAIGLHILAHGAVWPELGADAGIALGANQEDHALGRPWIVRMVGPEGQGRWTAAEIREAAEAFWQGRERCEVGADLEVWVTRVLHKVQLGIELDEEEGKSFTAMQFKINLGLATPVFLHDRLGVCAAITEKAQWLERYKAALARLWPEDAAALPPEKLTLVASGAMDALLFAGGAGVPYVLGLCLALLWSKQAREEVLPNGFELRRSNLRQFVLETVRRFPPVNAVGHKECCMGMGQVDQHVFLNLFMAQRDPRVWGADSDSFLLRPLEQYDRLSVGWAEPAVAPELASPNSHACPAKELSICMVCEMLDALLRCTIGEEAAAADKPLDKGQWACSKAEEDIGISEVSWDSFTLTRL